MPLIPLALNTDVLSVADGKMNDFKKVIKLPDEECTGIINDDEFDDFVKNLIKHGKKIGRSEGFLIGCIFCSMLQILIFYLTK